MTMYNPAFKRSSDDVAARLEQQRIAERQAQQPQAAYAGGYVPPVKPQVRVTIIAAPPTQASSARKPGGGPGRLAQFTPEYYERLAAQHRQTAVQFGNSQYNLQKARGYELRARQMRAQSAQIGPRLNKGFAPRTKY